MAKNSLLVLLIFFLSGLARGQTSASENIVSLELDAPQLDTLKRMWIYLPDNYDEEPRHCYPVLYMHDGQNLFDTSTAFSGEWRIDEWLDRTKGRKMIVVGIEHGNEKRIQELTPFPNPEYGGGGANAYLEFVVNDLKPYIDKHFRTDPNKTSTGIMGSSLGGLVSLYAMLQYPEVFGFAGVFSPSLWFNEEIFSFVNETELAKDQRFYILGGTEEGETMIPNMQRMTLLLLRKGIPEENLRYKTVEGGRHNEDLWAKEIPEALTWWLQDFQPNCGK